MCIFFKDNDDIPLVKTALLRRESAMERMVHRLTNMYAVLCANSPPRQARAHGREPGKSHESWAGWRNGEEAGLACDQSLRRKESKGFHPGQSWRLEVSRLWNLQPEGAEKAGRKQAIRRQEPEAPSRMVGKRVLESEESVA